MASVWEAIGFARHVPAARLRSTRQESAVAIWLARHGNDWKMCDRLTREEIAAMVELSKADAARAAAHANDFLGLTKPQATDLAARLRLVLRWVYTPTTGSYMLTDDQMAGRVTVKAREDGVAYEADADPW